jgi:penicillin-binding protein 1A
MVDALAFSLNAAAVRLMEEVGRKEVITVARRVGIEAPLPDRPSLALGSVIMSSLEPAGVLAVQGYDGAIVYWRSPKPRTARVVRSGDVSALTGMLREAMRRGTP